MATKKRKTGKAKPYPRRCAECGKQSVSAATISHVAKIKHDGKLHDIQIAELPVDKCSDCGEEFLTTLSSDAKSNALRKELGLLRPDEVRKSLGDLELTQRDFAKHLRVAEESVSRWLNSLSVQSRSLDTLMRLYFAVPEVRELLQSSKPIAPSLSPETIMSQAVAITQDHYQAGEMHPVFGHRFDASLIKRGQAFQLVPSRN